jgi:hypothetical protein
LNTIVWRKAESCHANGTCVEVARLSMAIGVRDSKRPADAHLTVSADAWMRFLSRLKETQ